MSNIKTLFVLRGCSGAGKSTWADDFAQKNSGTVVCSADHYFIGFDGVYRFRPSLLHEAHSYCRTKCEEAMILEVSNIIIDNTNIRRRDFEAYLGFADQYGYDVKEVVIGNFTDIDLYFQRNRHGVPREAIAKMAERWEE